MKNDPQYKQLQDKLAKLRSSARAAFRGINKNLEQDGRAERVGQAIENIMEETWTKTKEDD